MTTPNTTSVSIRVQLTAINVVSKPARRQKVRLSKKAFDFIPVQTEIDPLHVELQFKHMRAKRSYRFGLLTLKKDDIRKLNLMVGDTMNIEVSRDRQHQNV